MSLNMLLNILVIKKGVDASNIYWFKFNNRSTRKRCEIRSELTKTPERRH